MNQTGDDRIERLMEMEPATVMAGFRSGAISRRDLSKLFAALGLTTRARAGDRPQPRAGAVQRADDDRLGGLHLRLVHRCRGKKPTT